MQLDTLRKIAETVEGGWLVLDWDLNHVPCDFLIELLQRCFCSLSK